MGRVYSLSFDNVAVSAVQDLFQIEAQTVSAKLLGAFISQSSDLGDAESEGLRIRVRKGITTAITNSPAEAQKNASDGVAKANLNVNQTTQATAGATTYHCEVWNILTPFVWLPTPELAPVLEPGEAATIDIEAPADGITVCGTLYFEEQ